MFGYQVGATPQALARMTAERSLAQLRWPFLTSLDLSGIDGEQQLASMVKDRTGKSLADARSEVHEWMVGYHSRLARAANSRAELARWDNEGGLLPTPVTRRRRS
jgi:hypothetical protein